MNILLLYYSCCRDPKILFMVTGTWKYVAAFRYLATSYLKSYLLYIIILTVLIPVFQYAWFCL